MQDKKIEILTILKFIYSKRPKYCTTKIICDYLVSELNYEKATIKPKMRYMISKLKSMSYIKYVTKYQYRITEKGIEHIMDYEYPNNSFEEQVKQSIEEISNKIDKVINIIQESK